MHIYRQKSLIFLMGYLLIFLLIFVFAIVNLSKGTAIFDIGLSVEIENYIIIIFSFLAILKVVIEIIKIESHAEYEKKIKKFPGSGLKAR